MYSPSITDEAAVAPVAKETKSTESATVGNPDSAAAAASAMQPKKPLSAYNIFFLLHRKRLIQSHEGSENRPYTRGEVFGLDLNRDNQTSKPKRKHRKAHGMISFQAMAKVVSEKWRTMDDSERSLFDERAEDEKRKYAREIEAWLLKQDPSSTVKKRLAALRRGSLKRYLLQPSVKLPRAPKRPPPSPPRSISTESDATISVPPARSNTRLVEKTFIRSSPRGSHFEASHQGHNERSTDLQRLCDIQLELYQQQWRLHHSRQERIMEHTMAPAVNYFTDEAHHHGGYTDYQQAQHHYVPFLQSQRCRRTNTALSINTNKLIPCIHTTSQDKTKSNVLF